MSLLDVFRYDGFDVRAGLDDQGEPWFAAADIARILGYSSTSAMTRSVDDDEKGVRVLHTPGGEQSSVILTESGIYGAIIRSTIPRARDFRRWVTHEVLPSIRRTGSYAVTPSLPQSYADALRELASTVEHKDALEAKVAEDAPKVLFADSVSTSPTAILVGDLAKILKGNGIDVGANRLFEMLRNDGYLIRRKGTDWNMPTQRSMELGLFKVKETAVTHSDGHVTVNKTPKVTGKGQAYFVNRYSALRAVA